MTDATIGRVTGIHTSIAAPAIGSLADTESDAIVVTSAGTLVLVNRDGTLANYGSLPVGIYAFKTRGVGTGNTATVRLGYSVTA